MNKLEKLIEKLCPNGVEYKTLGEIGKICMCKRVMKNETNTVGGIPFYKIGTFGKKADAYITQELFDLYKNTYSYPKKGDILLSASGTIGRTVVFDGEPAYFQDSNIIWIDNNEQIITNRFLYYYYKIVSWKTEGGTIQRLYNDNLSKISVPIPPLPVQTEIVRILDSFTALEAELEAELEARRKQYEYYRNELLSFDKMGGYLGNISFLRKLCNKYCPNGVEHKTLGEMCEISRGRVISKDYIRDNPGTYPVYSSQTVNDGNLGNVSTFDYQGEYLTWTTDGANAGSIFYRNGCFNITNVCGLLKVKDSFVHIRYLFYWLTINAPRYVSSGMGNPKLMSNVISKISVPIPPLPVQEAIVSILDRFDALVNDISIGLPGELSARRKQYEYYRNRLLSFN